jgi:hypothetical protein
MRQQYFAGKHTTKIMVNIETYLSNIISAKEIQLSIIPSPGYIVVYIASITFSRNTSYNFDD